MYLIDLLLLEDNRFETDESLLVSLLIVKPRRTIVDFCFALDLASGRPECLEVPSQIVPVGECLDYVLGVPEPLLPL